MVENQKASNKRLAARFAGNAQANLELNESRNIMVGKLRRGYTNLTELMVLHSTTNYWEASERVAKRLDTSDFNQIKYWRMLSNLHWGNVKKHSWGELAKFLENCSEELFEYFFKTLNRSSEFDLAKFLTIIGNTKASGEDIYAFLVNMTDCIPNRAPHRKDNHLRFSAIEKALKQNPSLDFMEFEVLFNTEGYSTTFRTLNEIESRLKTKGF